MNAIKIITLAIAIACHEANRAYCRSVDDHSQPAWDDAPEWQKESAVLGVAVHLCGAITTPEQSHESWMAQKLADGWAYGETKDPDAKRHPCLVSYPHLPEEQREKDRIFAKTVADARKALGV